MSYIIWGSEAPRRDMFAPSADKQALGWIDAELPPHEWFNWYMNRTDRRLTLLENPVEYAVWISNAGTRGKTLAARERIDLPASYTVGAHQLRVYLDGLLCQPGEECQYVECGPERTESWYFRFNDEIDDSYDIRVEVEVVAHTEQKYPSENVRAEIENLRNELDRVRKPVFTQWLDYPPNERLATIPAGHVFTLSDSYLCHTNQLLVFKNGTLLTERIDYLELGESGIASTDISFTEDLLPSDYLRIMILYETGERYNVLGAAPTLEIIGREVAKLVEEERLDTVIEQAIEAGAHFSVPCFLPDTNTLRVYRDGALLVPGRDYTEDKTDSASSSYIIWNSEVPAGCIITTIVPKLAQ